MKIVDFRIHPIAIADPPLRSSYGLHAPYALRTIIELVSEDGVVGIAETYGGEAQVGQLEALRGRIVGEGAWRGTGRLGGRGLRGGWGGRVEGGVVVGDRSQTYHVPGENPLDAMTRTYAAIEVAAL